MHENVIYSKVMYSKK